ncbi:hypothetical protein [Streptomyces sp. NPDC029004]|uniref:hypothetical protein n=1 Tax=Streptomyces sp. NPDC029004 TaxID=3154490 RepID=UPI0033CA83E4
MIGRSTLPTFALTLFGVAIGFVGLYDEGGHVTHAVILVYLSLLPPFIVWQARLSHRNSADQLTDAHTAGYTLGLDHVARGLLNQPTPPDGDHRAEQVLDDCADLAEHRAKAQATATMRRLHSIRSGEDNDTERKAL